MRAIQVVRDEGQLDERTATQQRPPLQREVLRDVMLSAAQCNTWLTLEELARMTSYPPASISAQLRHLRKEQHGGYRMEKRCRGVAKFMAGVDECYAIGREWEYPVDRWRRAARVVGQGSGLGRESRRAAVSA